jgi:hypothetical protein
MPLFVSYDETSGKVAAFRDRSWPIVPESYIRVVDNQTLNIY